MRTFEKLAIALGMTLATSSLVSDVRSTPRPVTVPISCSVEKNNDGCTTTVRCPEGTKVSSASAACNLEWGPVTQRHLSKLPADVIEVVRPSDHVDEGRCWVGATSLSQGRATIRGIARQTSVTVGCQEHDQNGGDCQVRGSLSCE